MLRQEKVGCVWQKGDNSTGRVSVLRGELNLAKRKSTDTTPTTLWKRMRMKLDK